MTDSDEVLIEQLQDLIKKLRGGDHNSRIEHWQIDATPLVAELVPENPWRRFKAYGHDLKITVRIIWPAVEQELREAGHVLVTDVTPAP